VLSGGFFTCGGSVETFETFSKRLLRLSPNPSGHGLFAANFSASCHRFSSVSRILGDRLEFVIRLARVSGSEGSGPAGSFLVLYSLGIQPIVETAGVLYTPGSVQVSI